MTSNGTKISKAKPTKDCYAIVKHRYITEKAVVLENLKNGKSNPSLLRFELPKYVFVVDKRANKQEIAQAIEEIYADKNVKVLAVNTIQVKSKPKRFRGRPGKTASFKKAIVTLAKGNILESV